MTADSDRSPDPQVVREPAPVVAEAALPAFDVPVQGEASGRDRSEASGRDRSESRAPREPERAAESAQSVEQTVIAPQLGAGLVVQPVSRDEQPRPVEAARPARPPIDVPPITSTLPPDSGLEIVETRFKPAPAADPEPVPSGPRRVRPPRVAIADEPLQIVETRKGEQPPA